MPSTLTSLDFFVIFSYMLMMVVIGGVLGLFVKNIKDYFAGGGSIPWYLGAVSNYMTMMSTYVFVASAGIAYDEGIVAIVILWSAIPPTIVTTIWLAKRWKRAGIITPVEYLETRFDGSVRQLSSWGGVAFRILDNMVRLYAIGIFVSGTTGFSLSESILFCGIVVVIYTMIGGLCAVVITDTVQCVILVMICLVVTPLTMMNVGGFTALYQSEAQAFGLGNGPKGQYWFLAVYYLMILIKYNGNWAFIQRFYSMENEREARKMGVLSAILFFVFPILFLLPAIAGRMLFPELENSETVYVNICKTFLPSGVLGLMISAMFAATMSTLSSEYNVTAGVLTKDVYQRLLRPNASERESMFVARLMTLLLGTAIMLGALNVGKIGGAFEANKLFTGLIGVPIVVPLVFGILWKRPKPIGAVLAIVGGFLVGLFLNRMSGIDWGSGGTVQSALNGISALSWETATFIQICCCLVFFFSSSLLPDANAEYSTRVDAFFRKLKSPFVADESLQDRKPLKNAMFLLLTISGLLCGMLFIFVSFFHWGTDCGRLTFIIGTVCSVLAVIQAVILRRNFIDLWRSGRSRPSS